MATDWSEAAKAKRSASAKKAAETRKANRLLGKPGMKEAIRENAAVMRTVKRTTYFTNSRVARWALSGVSVLAMMHRPFSPRQWVYRPAYIFQRG